MHRCQPIIIASHPRSGTHLTLDLMRKQFPPTRAAVPFMKTAHLQYLTLEHVAPGDEHELSVEQATHRLAQATRPLVKTHLWPGFEALGAKHEAIWPLLREAPTIYIVRDGRAVMCSAHLWRLKRDPAAPESLSAFLRSTVEGMSWPAHWAEHVRRWSNQPHVLMLHYERIVAQPGETLEQIGQFLELTPVYRAPLLPKRRRFRGRFAELLRRVCRQHESTTITARPRGMRPARWQDAFSPADHQFFEQQAGDTLQQLGYPLKANAPSPRP